jgi:N utilization substance protein B
MAGKPTPRGRTVARVAAVQALFQLDQTGDALDQVIDQFVRHRLNPVSEQTHEDGHLPEADVALFSQIVRAAVAKADQLDALIIEALPAEWPLARLDAVLRSLLRAGAAELAQADGPPSRVIINEYLDVAHSFFSGDEAKLVNGLLDKLAHQLRADEFKK